MIIGVTGRKGSGKDTLARLLIERHGFQKLAFATPLKSIARRVFALSDRQLELDLKEVPDTRWFGWTPRQILQWIGTEAGRMNDFSWAGSHETELRECFTNMGLVPGESCWVDYLQRHLGPKTVVTDVRFPNEASMLRREGAILWKVVRPGRTSEFSNHPSELFIDSLLVDHTFLNDGTIAELYASATDVLFPDRLSSR